MEKCNCGSVCLILFNTIECANPSCRNFSEKFSWEQLSKELDAQEKHLLVPKPANNWEDIPF